MEVVVGGGGVGDDADVGGRACVAAAGVGEGGEAEDDVAQVVAVAEEASGGVAGAEALGEELLRLAIESAAEAIEDDLAAAAGFGDGITADDGERRGGAPAGGIGGADLVGIG